MKKPKNLWCGFNLSKFQQRALTSLTMREFDKSVKDRKKPIQLIEIIFGENFKQIQKEYEEKYKKGG